MGQPALAAGAAARGRNVRGGLGHPRQHAVTDGEARRLGKPASRPPASRAAILRRANARVVSALARKCLGHLAGRLRAAKRAPRRTRRSRPRRRQYTMILTQCAVCAADLGLSLGKQCSRCKTRYCGAECQVQHWKDGGHDQLCKNKKAGGAEQYQRRNKKCTEAVAVAAEACAEDTPRARRATSARRPSTGKRRRASCACVRAAGRRASRTCRVSRSRRRFWSRRPMRTIWTSKVLNERWVRWHTCGLCEQHYHGVVRCALGWACWKTYVGRPETDWARKSAMSVLGNGYDRCTPRRGRVVRERGGVVMLRRLGESEESHSRLAEQYCGTYEGTWTERAGSEAANVTYTMDI